jgi:hypothetical protein
MDLVFLKKNERPEKHLWLSALPGYEPQGQNKNNLGSCPPLGFLQRLHPAAHLCITNKSHCFCFVPRVIIVIPQFIPLFNKKTSRLLSLFTPRPAPPREAQAAQEPTCCDEHQFHHPDHSLPFVLVPA